MTRQRLYFYDTSLRDGQQTFGAQFSTDEKIQLTKSMDDIGIDYIEGGWPGANPTDNEFFDSAPSLRSAKLAAFGMTKRAGRSARNDPTLASVLNAGTKTVCVVGKASAFQVKSVLRVSLEENLSMISDSIAHITKLKREAIFDAEHFFDGFKLDPSYSIESLFAAFENGARWIVLCDTNGGTLPEEIRRITRKVIESGIPGSRLGIHTHNDTENAVAGSLAAVDVGVRQVQGTLNGIGERCGNANLVSLIPTLLLKEPYRSTLRTRITDDGLRSLTQLSRQLDDILNRVPLKSAPYVGASAFAHKAGLHASGVGRNPSSYEHVDPAVIGNLRVIPMSGQAGRSSLVKRLQEAGIRLKKDDPRIPKILKMVKEREDLGYSYDMAQASFEVFARRELGLLPDFFSVERYRVLIERQRRRNGGYYIVSEAVVVLDVHGERKLSVSEGLEETGKDSGPVHALSKAIAKDLGPYQEYIQDMRLVDFKVRIISGGTEAVTRVIIDCEDRLGRRWSTVGVSPNIVDASFEALKDAICWKLDRDLAKAH